MFIDYISILNVAKIQSDSVIPFLKIVESFQKQFKLHNSMLTQL